MYNDDKKNYSGLLHPDFRVVLFVFGIFIWCDGTLSFMDSTVLLFNLPVLSSYKPKVLIDIKGPNMDLVNNSSTIVDSKNYWL